ncbi:MAG: hypothetical protein IJT83_06450 [Victivallales bacterium]|nr:hypothetical protein [Victivallales bacterium]
MNTYTQSFSIRYSELNRNGLLKDEAFFDIFQEVASRHAEQLGCGFGTMGSLTWVLSKIRIQVLRTPGKGSTVTVKTWPSGFNRLYATREGLFADGDGELARVTSYWLLIDLKTLRPSVCPMPCRAPYPTTRSCPGTLTLPQRQQKPLAETRLSPEWRSTKST